MHLVSLRLRNFRNYRDEKVFFHPKINLVLGENGAGKTNLLEAIFFLSTGKSFRSSSLKELIHEEASFFYLEAEFKKDGVSQVLKVGYDEENKKIEHNATTLPSFSNLLGIMPSVLFCPKDLNLISGSPQDRRRFINIHIAQSSPLYVHHLIRYSNALKQRNELLKQRKISGLECFEIEMAKSSVFLMEERAKRLDLLQKKLEETQKELSTQEESYSIKYQPSFSLTKGISAESFVKQYEKTREKELLYKVTLIGPHRDDFLIFQEKKPAKSFSSEGQKRTFLAALKFAEYDLLKENTNTLPLMSIDDIGMHLSSSRKNLLHQRLLSLNQVFLTAPTGFDSMDLFSIEVNDGKIKASTALLSN